MKCYKYPCHRCKSIVNLNAWDEVEQSGALFPWQLLLARQISAKSFDLERFSLGFNLGFNVWVLNWERCCSLVLPLGLINTEGQINKCFKICCSVYVLCILFNLKYFFPLQLKFSFGKSCVWIKTHLILSSGPSRLAASRPRAKTWTESKSIAGSVWINCKKCD